MRIEVVLLVLVSVFLSASSQVMLKLGMSSPEIQLGLAGQEPMRIALSILRSPWVLAGLFCFGLSAVFWLFVLSKIAVSTAYPFVALGIVITTVSGRLILGEPLTALKTIGIGLIVLGVVAVGASS
jgi:multidrug transporter EmrE-like cation transporter